MGFITNAGVMDKLDMFEAIFEKVDEFGWWYLEIIKIDSDTQFTFKEFQEGLSVHGLRLALAATDHQEMNVQTELTSQTVQTIAHSIMVHAHISDQYIHFALMYTTDHIFTVLPIKYLVNQNGEPTTTLVQNPQYQAYVFYSTHVLYKKQLRIFTQRSWNFTT